MISAIWSYRVVLAWALVSGTWLVLSGQTLADDLRQRLIGKESPREVMVEVDAVYQGRQEVDGLPKYKHWLRWAHWWSMHTQADGSFGDPSRMNRRAVRDWPDLNGLRNSNSTWSSIGPIQSTYANNAAYCAANGYGRMDRIAFHPTDANTIYAAAPYGGLWRTTDPGNSWECLTDALPGIGVGGMVIDHTDPDTIYVLSGSGDDALTAFVGANGFFNVSDGIFKSHDGGATWHHILEFPQVTRARRMKQHPAHADTLFALTDIGVYRSANGGASWDTVITGDYTDIEFHPTDHDTVYISGFSTFRYSHDGGVTWNTTLLSENDTTITPQFCGGRIEIAVSPVAADNVWLLAGPRIAPDTFCGLFLSTSAADTFTLIDYENPNLLGRPGSASDQSNYDIALAVSPADSETIFAGGLIIRRTLDGSASWAIVAPFFETPGGQQGTLPNFYVHPDIHELAFNPLDSKLYCVSDGGIYVSSNNGSSWNNISQGIVTSQVYKMNGSAVSADRLTVGLQDNGVKMRLSSASQDFQHLASGDGFEAVVDPGNTNIVLASINQGLWHFDEYDETDATKLIDEAGQWFKPVRFKPDDGNVIYYGNSPLTIQYIDGSNPLTVLPGSASWSIETCADIPGRIYFAGGATQFLNDSTGTFYVSLNGTTSDDMSTTPGFPSELQKITDIAVFPGQCHRVAFSMGGYIEGNKVFYSAVSGGGSWQNISYNLPNVPVFSLAIDADGNFYAGTEIGVFVKSETGTAWSPYYNGLPRVPVTGLVVQESTNRLIASTFGRGVWHAFLADGCSLNTLVTSQLTGQKVYSADISVTSTSTITGGAGTDIRFSAGERVILEAGFTAFTGNRFIADLEGCID